MKLLLDTHAFIWWVSEPAKLSTRALSLCQDSDNQLYLSVASLWEIQIKSHLGKLRLSTPLPDIVAAQQEANGFLLLSIHASHAYALDELPALHNDPFDRMLVAQARSEGLHLITHDEIVRKYPVKIEW